MGLQRIGCNLARMHVRACMLSYVGLFAALQTVALQAPLSMGFNIERLSKAPIKETPQQVHLQLSTP